MKIMKKAKVTNPRNGKITLIRIIDQDGCYKVMEKIGKMWFTISFFPHGVVQSKRTAFAKATIDFETAIATHQ